MIARAPVGLGWIGIVRLGLVQAAIGSIVMLATSLLNRVMVVEYALPAALPAGLVAWHYAVQLSRPVWGHGSDRGAARTPWIVLGMALLATGVPAAVGALALMAARSAWGLPLAIFAFAMIGAGVGAAGTSLLTLLALRVAPGRRAAAASITWIMMISGIVISAGVAGKLIDPFSLPRLAKVTGGVAACAFGVAMLGVWGIERSAPVVPGDVPRASPQKFAVALRAMMADDAARRFTVFVFLSMFAYSMQELILEPFAGLLFAYTPGQSTQLGGILHAGVLGGMVLTGVGGSTLGRRTPDAIRRWIVGGCAGSALALAGLVMAARAGPGWPLAANIMVLGIANGVFAVSAIGAMMGLAGADGGSREGMRMGVWGAAQALAFAGGGLLGAVGLDVGRALIGSAAQTFKIVFALQAVLFMVAASLALHSVARAAPSQASLA